MSVSTVQLLFTRFSKVMKRFMGGDQWFTKEAAVPRLDELEKSLFSNYEGKHLFGVSAGTVRDGIGFPSLEGALLSLAFLTCAVFLIDLIQMVLIKIRLRNAILATPAVALGRTLDPIQNRLPYHHYHYHGNTIYNYPTSMEILSTMSSKVLSAIERSELNGYRVKKSGNTKIVKSDIS